MAWEGDIEVSQRSETMRGLRNLPGGSSEFLATLLQLLEQVKQTEQPTSDSLADWICHQYAPRARATAEADIRIVASMGYLDIESSPIRIMQRGHHLLETRDGGIVLNGLMTEWVAVYEALAAVDSHGGATAKAVFFDLFKQGYKWKTDTQCGIRLNWLHSLGCVVKVAQEYVITQLGRQALIDYASLRHNSDLRLPELEVSASTLNGPVDIGAGVTLDEGESAEELDTHASANAEGESEQLAQRIVATAKVSDDPTGFERILVDAFTFLGFDAKHRSGSGDTDVLVTAPIGPETYHAVVDGKSSRHDKVSNQQVNWLALNHHKVMHRADYILVVAPGFSDGDLSQNARDTNVCLMTAEGLAAIVRLHASAPFSLTDLRELFMHPGESDASLPPLREKAAETARLQDLLPDIIAAFRADYWAGERDPISAEVVSRLITHARGRAHDRARYTKDEIGAALSLLASPLLGVLRRVSDTTYILQMPAKSTERRMRELTRHLSDAGPYPM